MKASVVICTYDPDMFDHFMDAVDSVFSQTYDNLELVVVVDGREELAECIQRELGGRETVQLHCNDENRGLLQSRNFGAEIADGEIIAFLDDDAIADDEWIRKLVTTYKERDAIAVGGKMTPKWVNGKPSFLPEEFYWLVGVTHEGFAEGPGEVRNTFGSNLSFRREVFQDLGGFDTEIGGRKGDKNLQGGETELCVRMQYQYGQGVWYEPKAIVAHKVFSYRTNFWWLVDRAFWQGYSKRAMEAIQPSSGREENQFLYALLTDFLPSRVKGLLINPKLESLSQLMMLIVLSGAVGSGYFYGMLRW